MEEVKKMEFNHDSYFVEPQYPPIAEIEAMDVYQLFDILSKQGQLKAINIIVDNLQRPFIDLLECLEIENSEEEYKNFISDLKSELEYIAINERKVK